MDELALLRMCILTALIGLLALGVLPSLPSQDTYGRLVWSQEHRGLIEYTQTRWIESAQPINLAVPQCVRVRGVHVQDTIKEALLASAPATNCS